MESLNKNPIPQRGAGGVAENLEPDKPQLRWSCRSGQDVETPSVRPSDPIGDTRKKTEFSQTDGPSDQPIMSETGPICASRQTSVR